MRNIHRLLLNVVSLGLCIELDFWGFSSSGGKLMSVHVGPGVSNFWTRCSRTFSNAWDQENHTLLSMSVLRDHPLRFRNGVPEHEVAGRDPWEAPRGQCARQEEGAQSAGFFFFFFFLLGRQWARHWEDAQNTGLPGSFALALKTGEGGKDQR